MKIHRCKKGKAGSIHQLLYKPNRTIEKNNVLRAKGPLLMTALSESLFTSLLANQVNKWFSSVTEHQSDLGSPIPKSLLEILI